MSLGVFVLCCFVYDLNIKVHALSNKVDALLKAQLLNKELNDLKLNINIMRDQFENRGGGAPKPPDPPKPPPSDE